MDVLHNITKLTISIKRNTTTILNAKFWEEAKLKKISSILEKNIILYILYIFEFESNSPSIRKKLPFRNDMGLEKWPYK